MEFFKQWCFSVCVTLVVAVIFSVFTPKGSMKRFYKILISVFIFVSFLYPFQHFSAREFLPDEAFHFEEQSAYAAPYEAMISHELQQTLREMGVTGAGVSSTVAVDYSSGEITVKSVQVTVPDGCDKEETAQALFDKTGIKARVIYVGE